MRWIIFTIPTYLGYEIRISKFSYLKVPKRENFSLAFFALSEPIWVCDLGTGKLTPDFDGFWFFAAN